jgi:DNA ligase-associated metallophosphoesterase
VQANFLLQTNNGSAVIMGADRTLWLPNYEILVISDLHIGKAQHFRKHGIPIPMEAAFKNLELFKIAVLKRRPKQLILLGDLFHSRLNSEWPLFVDLISSLRQEFYFDIVLTIGNHDILSSQDYLEISAHCVPFYEVDELYFIHEPITTTKNESNLIVCGHLHPGVIVKGKARSKIKLPCFGLQNQCLIMPSFGNLTGSININWQEDSRTWAILNNTTIQEIRSENRL